MPVIFGRCIDIGWRSGPSGTRGAFVAVYRGDDTGVDWQLTSYGGAVRSFTDVNANVPGTAQYSEKVSRRAFASMDALLKEVFAQS